MAKAILCIGQSLMERMFSVSSGTCTPHADTHMWDGSGWVAPTGDGAITYANCLRTALQEHIYLIPAAVGNTPLLPYTGMTCWSNAAGSLVCNAIAQTQAALGSVSGLCLDRVEWWQGQHECYTGGYSNMYGDYLAGLGTLLATLRSALGTDFRFCIWPVNRVHTGTIANVLRAQMEMANAPGAPALGIEPGPSSYDRGYSDGVHLGSGAEYLWMGIRGARNACSYFDAKAHAADTIPHYGAGPVIESLLRHPNGTTPVLFAIIRAKNGFSLLPTNPWGSSDLEMNAFQAAWASGSHSGLPLTGSQLMGNYVRMPCSWNISYPAWVSYWGEYNCSAANVVYDTNAQFGGAGQPLLALPLGALTSN